MRLFVFFRVFSGSVFLPRKARNLRKMPQNQACEGCFIVQPEGFALSLEQLCCAALMRLFVFLVALFFCHERHEIYEKYFRR
jgi:hypothetical protein